MNAKIIIVILLVFTQLSAHAQIRCQNLIYSIDSKLNFEVGKVNQNDTYFLERHLISVDKSMLCGPTCAINVIQKLKKDYQLRPYKDPKKHVSDIVESILPSKGISKNVIIEQGITLENIKTALVHKFENSDIDPNIYINSVFSPDFQKNITLSILKSGIKKRNAVILLLGVYKGENLAENYIPERLGGHFVVVVGTDLKNPNVLYIQDPSEPDLIKKLHFKPIKPKVSLISTVEIVNENGTSLVGQQAIVDGFISINEDE